MAKGTMTIQGIVAMAIGILGLIIIYTVIPLVGSEMDQAVVLPGCTNNTNATTCNATKLPGSAWNSTVDSDVPTAVSLWTSIAGILIVAVIIIIVGGFLIALRTLRTYKGTRGKIEIWPGFYF